MAGHGHMPTNSHAIHRSMISRAALGSGLGWVGWVEVGYLFVWGWLFGLF